jgi:hypothetical protein
MSLNQDFTPGSFILAITDIHKSSKFSKLTPFSFHGIRPNLLFFFEDRKVYTQGISIHGYAATAIRQCEIDPDTGVVKSPLRDIWAGATGIGSEGPHMYRKDGDDILLGATKSEIITPSSILTFMGQHQTSLNSLVRLTIVSVMKNNDV